MLKREELLRGNGQESVLEALRDMMYMNTIEEVKERIECHRLIEIAERINSEFISNVDKALDMVKEANSLAEEAGETLDFLVRRNASRESIAGMSVVIYHANNLYSLGSDIATSLQDTEEAGL